MEQNYSAVPNIISSKDLDYLSDMFNWNYGAYKTNFNASTSVQDEEISMMISNASNVFYANMTKVLNIINNGGNNEQ